MLRPMRDASDVCRCGCGCGRETPTGICPVCDEREGLGLDARGGYGSEPEGTYAAAVMARPVPRMRDLAAQRAARASEAAAKSAAVEAIRRAA